MLDSVPDDAIELLCHVRSPGTRRCELADADADEDADAAAVAVAVIVEAGKEVVVVAVGVGVVFARVMIGTRARG